MIEWLFCADKNPHPDAQAAFDALQDAYSTLTQSELRSQYDMDLARARKGRRLSIRRTRKLLNEWYTTYTMDMMYVLSS